MGQNPNLVCIMNWWFGVLGIWDFDERFYENVELTYEFLRRKKKKRNIRDSEESSRKQGDNYHHFVTT